METVENDLFRSQLMERRHRLEGVMAHAGSAAELTQLVAEVDAALARLEGGRYGTCETCHDPIEPDRLVADPLTRFCLDHLPPDQVRALEADLELASRVQRSLLPPQSLTWSGWHAQYQYEPAGVVSGDYCDVIQPGDQAGAMLALVGDVSGKGVAASMLMTHLHAMFRSLARVETGLEPMLHSANRVFCESALAGQYATLVCVRAGRNGEVELAGAGHLPALVLRKDGVKPVESSGLPLGLSCESRYPVTRMTLAPNESLVLYTDGLTEAVNATKAEYGLPRLTQMVSRCGGKAPGEILSGCLEDVRRFAGSGRPSDDLTILVLQRG